MSEAPFEARAWASIIAARFCPSARSGVSSAQLARAQLTNKCFSPDRAPQLVRVSSA